MDIVENNTNENMDIEDFEREILILKELRRKKIAPFDIMMDALLVLILYFFDSKVIMQIITNGIGTEEIILIAYNIILTGIGLTFDFYEVKNLITDLKLYNRLIKYRNNELNKIKIIDKIKEINKEKVNVINIDRKQQRSVDKLLDKLKKITSEEEYQTTVDEIFNERVPLEEDEYTVTEENHASIEPGSIAHAYSTNNAVKKKVLVRR